MISTPLSLFLDRTPPPTAGRATQSADVTAAGDFADLMSQLFYANMPVAALARAAEIPDTTVPLPDGERIEREPRTESDAEAAQRDRARLRNEETPAADEPRDFALTDPTTTFAFDEGLPQTGEGQPAAPPLPQTPSQAVPGVGTPPAQQAADRPLTQNAPPVMQAKESDPPQAATQQMRQAQAGAGDFPRVQVVDSAANDQPPPLGHMLSGRAAVIAQSDGGAASPIKDATVAPKGGIAEQPAAALFGGAAQATSVAAQKAKGQSRPANMGSAGQAAGTTQPAQLPGAQAQPTAAPAQAAAQSGFDGALAAASNGSSQAGSLSPQAPRSEPLPLAGSGQHAPQANFRAAESAAASKPRMPVPPRFIADQVAVQIQKSLGQGNDRISIQLKPAELGKVEVRLDVGHEGRVTAVITADRADTLDLLQRDARILQHSLQDAGLRADSNSLSFELRSQGQGFDNTQNGTGGRGGFDDTGTDDGNLIDRGAPPARPAIVTNDRVDIHV